MVVCNICRKNKPIGEIKEGFRYVCKECWDRLEITIDEHRINKELLY